MLVPLIKFSIRNLLSFLQLLKSCFGINAVKILSLEEINWFEIKYLTFFRHLFVSFSHFNKLKTSRLVLCYQHVRKIVHARYIFKYTGWLALSELNDRVRSLSSLSLGSKSSTCRPTTDRVILLFFKRCCNISVKINFHFQIDITFLIGCVVVYW